MTRPAPFPFILGSVRSGTTMLRLMLNAHPDMAIPPESYFPVELWPWHARYESPNGFNIELLAETLLTSPHFTHFRDNWDLDPQFVRLGLSGVHQIDYAEAIRRVFLLYAEAHGKTRIGDKTPWFVLHIPLLADLFPDARFVHLVRDGRNVALSMLDTPWGPSRLTDAALLWRRLVLTGRKAGRQVGPDRYKEIFYEELVDNPAAVLAEVCSFVELDYRPEMTRYYENGSEWIPGRLNGGDPNLAGPPRRDLRRWRTDMSQDSIATFEATAARALREFGYELASAPIPVTARARALGGLALNQSARVARNTYILTKRVRYVFSRVLRMLRKGFA